MPAESRFLNDKLETLVRKCIVFPADGSQTCLAHTVVRTVTNEDTSSLGIINRCVEMSARFGDQNRKTRVLCVGQNLHMFYNLSLDLPINLNIARLIGVTPAQLKRKKRLFWRGDVVVMKALPESETIDFIVKPLEASISDVNDVESSLRVIYQEGRLENDLSFAEEQWKFYVSSFCGPTALMGSPKTYWGNNASQKEEEFLCDLNEQRFAVGRPPIPRHAYMRSYTEVLGAMFSTIKSVFWKDITTVTGPPLLPPQLERYIFETCAFENPEVCTVLVLVAKRVHEWLDPILIKTICVTQDISKSQDKLAPLLARLSNGKHVSYYAEHVKNVAFFGFFWDKAREINRVLSICTGISNLVINAAISPNGVTSDLNLFGNPHAWGSLRRLTISISKHVEYREPTFYHSCFRNLTHLHLLDDDEDWPYYTGWENLIRLTHLAFACSGPPQQLMALLRKLPSVQYVALGSYHSGQQYKYAETTINNSPHIRAAWGTRIVFLGTIPESDWERGARGDDDFWDLVEQEVDRRLQLQDGLVG